MIIFVSNFVSPHTIPLCEQLYYHRGNDFLFIETKRITLERQNLGYSELQSKPFVVSYKKYIDNTKYYNGLIDSADIVMASFGSVDSSLLNCRLRNNKLTFVMSERLFKKGLIKIFDPKFWRTFLFLYRYRKKNIHLLCMGAYVSKDFGLCGFPKNKMWKFGYITADPNVFEKRLEVSRVVNILWVGRMIWWKRPFDVVKAAEILKNSGIEFHLDVVGGGKLVEKFQSQLKSSNAKDMITYHGLKTGTEVQLMMQRADILLCTSNRLEGWGAVINEGMYNRCVVVASKTMGAAPYLIEDGKTGYLYQGNARALAFTIMRVIRDGKIHQIANNASDYIKENWSPEEGARKFLQLVDMIQHSSITVGGNGICTKA